MDPNIPNLEPNAVTKDERTWGLIVHLSGFAGYLCPFANIVVPLIIWKIKGKEMPFLDDQGREAVNFQITVMLWAVASVVLALISLGLLFFVPVLVGIAAAVLMIIGALKANEGTRYRYPLTLRLV